MTDPTGMPPQEPLAGQGQPPQGPPPQPQQPPQAPPPGYGQQPPYGQQSPYGQQAPYGQQPQPQPRPDTGDPLVSVDYQGWWRRGVMLAKYAWKPLLAVQLVGAVLSLILDAIPAFYRAGDAVGQLERGGAPGDPFAPLIGAGLNLAVLPFQFVITALVTLASVHVVVTAAATGRRLGLGEALRAATSRLAPLVGWSFVFGLLILVGLCACVLPGAYLWLVGVLLPAVVAFERTNPVQRCFQLFHVDVGAALARTATIAGLTFAAAAVAGVLASIALAIALAAASGTAAVLTATLLGGLFGGLVAAAVGLLTAPLTVVAYADLRARREPVTTAQLAAELAA